MQTVAMRLQDLAKIDHQVAEKYVLKWILSILGQRKLTIKPDLTGFRHLDVVN